MARTSAHVHFPENRNMITMEPLGTMSSGYGPTSYNNELEKALPALPDIDYGLSPKAPINITEEYPKGFRLAFIMVALVMAMFLVALDMTIVATAIPRITDDFHSLDQVGWYGVGFYLTVAAFQSAWGKVYKFFPLKMAFIISFAIFELGSLLCGVARNSAVLIVGRVIAGIDSPSMRARKGQADAEPRLGWSRHFVRSLHYHRFRSGSGSASCSYWYTCNGVGSCQRCWSSSGRCIYHACDVAVVVRCTLFILARNNEGKLTSFKLLYQHSDRRRIRRHLTLFLPSTCSLKARQGKPAREALADGSHRSCGSARSYCLLHSASSVGWDYKALERLLSALVCCSLFS